MSGAVHQCRAPDPAGSAAVDANKTRGRRGAADRETAAGATKGGDEERASRGNGAADDKARASRGEGEDGGD